MTTGILPERQLIARGHTGTSPVAEILNEETTMCTAPKLPSPTFKIAQLELQVGAEHEGKNEYHLVLSNMGKEGKFWVFSFLPDIAEDVAVVMVFIQAIIKVPSGGIFHLKEEPFIDPGDIIVFSRNEEMEGAVALSFDQGEDGSEPYFSEIPFNREWLDVYDLDWNEYVAMK